MKKIKLRNSEQVALVDDEDYESFKDFKWRLQPTGYCARSERVPEKHSSRIVYLHKSILKVPTKYTVDHKDGDRLNNQRANLRVATYAQNNANKRGYGMSGHKGVFPISGSKRYMARIKPPGKKCIYLGSFDDPQEAAKVYAAKSLEYYGDFSYQR